MNVDALEKMLAAGNDSAMLRFTLGKAYLDRGETSRAIGHLREAVRLDSQYSAAWKWLGRALAAAERNDEAMHAFREGIAVASAKGDKQASREMQVFMRRLEKAARGD